MTDTKHTELAPVQQQPYRAASEAEAVRVRLVAENTQYLITQVTANTDAEAAANQLLKNLHDLLVAAGTDPGKLQALANTLNGNRVLAAAIVAGTLSA